jgi:hypothetical protein
VHYEQRALPLSNWACTFRNSISARPTASLLIRKCEYIRGWGIYVFLFYFVFFSLTFFLPLRITSIAFGLVSLALGNAVECAFVAPFFFLPQPFVFDVTRRVYAKSGH